MSLETKQTEFLNTLISKINSFSTVNRDHKTENYSNFRDTQIMIVTKIDAVYLIRKFCYREKNRFYTV